MKKISMILFAVAMMVSFAACNSTKKEETPAQDEAKQEVKEEAPAAPAGEAANADEFIANYEKLMNDMIPVMEKVAKGDAAATQEYAKYSEQAQKIAADAQKFMPNFTPEQMKKFQEIGQKYAEAVQKMTPKQ